MHVVRKTEVEAAGDALTHQHHQREWRQGTGQEGGRRGGRGLGGGCKTDMQSALLGEVADIKGAGRCRVERKGSRVVSHLHSPTKFLYFETKGMRQNRVRRVSPVEQQTASEQRQRS